MTAEPGTGEHAVMVAAHSERVEPLRHLRPALLVRVAQRNQEVPAGGKPSANGQVRMPARPKRFGELLIQGVERGWVGGVAGRRGGAIVFHGLQHTWLAGNHIRQLAPQGMHGCGLQPTTALTPTGEYVS
ncbi:hypothetical protein GCM10011504_51340 [Siccirubricoccus deserti]|nr:hypothetical protein GCM10011504_51340 [Siccirubricoccus deserti]